MSGSNSNSSLSLFPDHDTNRATVMEWLNQAALSVDTSERVQLLHKVQEFLLRKCPWLLSELLQDVLGYTADRNTDVKKCIVGFIEEACKQDVKTIPKVIVNLHMLLCDESVQVQKRVIQASNSIYKNMISWLSKAQVITDDMEQAWNNLNHIKVEIVNMIDSDNDGVRTNSIKFLEGVVLLQTYPDPGAPRKDNDFSLEDIPLTLKIARRRKLEEEANHIFSLLVKFHGSPHISSVNLMACMGSLCTIARSRSEFMPKVINALENLHSNLPPTLSHSQVSSVRKHLKLQMLNILKHPSSSDQRTTVVELLTELGCTNTELSKLIPRGEEKKRIQKRISDIQISSIAKKAKLIQEVEEKMIVESPFREKQAYEVNHQFVTDNLNINVATSIIFATIKSLPTTMPSLFQTEYIKYYENPNPATLSDVVKLLAEQITTAKLGPGAKIESSFRVEPETLSVIEPEKDAFVFKDIIENKPKELKITRQVRTRTKALKLVEVTKALSCTVKEHMLVNCVERILQSEKSLKLSVMHSRYKIITTLASTFSAPVREKILMFLLSDIRLHIDLALAWLYEEYSLMQGFSRMSIIAKRPEKPDQSYNTLLCALVNNLQTVDLRDRDGLLARLFLEAPLVTDEALDCLKLMCRQLDKCVVALNLMHDLVVRRPPRGQQYLNALLEYCTFEDSMVREEAIARVLSLYERLEWQPHIERNAMEYLDLLKNGKPPIGLFGVKTGRLLRVDNWSDDLNRVCLGLYLALLPYNEVLIHELAKVYTQTHADIKRTILRLLEPPIRGMGMDSTELLLLVEKCPKGSETMVTRIIHILSDRGPPSAQLVNRVRELYQSRVSDVRFLIPVLNGLTKKEVTAALPKLIKLNPIVVKEVFNRLLGLHGDSPITPTELLIALHVIDPSKAEIKAIMKATSLCFAEKQIYTQEVLAVVIQQLMEINPLPTLLMRTVIQSLSLYPRLTGFVMNILQRLITKQVWRQKVVWEGFIKCCQRTKPQSFQVILQLPPPQLEEALKVCPDIKAPLLEHIQSLTDAQRSHVPAATIEVLVGPTQSVPTPAVIPILQATASIVTVTEETSNSSEAKLILDEPLPPGMD